MSTYVSPCIFNEIAVLGVLVLHCLVLGSGVGGAQRSVRSFQKLPPCLAEQIPDGSEDEHAAGQDWAE